MIARRRFKSAVRRSIVLLAPASVDLVERVVADADLFQFGLGFDHRA